MKNERLIQKRHELGLTQTEVGNMVGVTQVTLSGIELGVSNGTDDLKAKLAKLYGVTVDWLFFDLRYGGSNE